MLSARPSTPIESGWRVHISGVAIERYWWMRAMIVGCDELVAALRRRRLERRLAVRRCACVSSQQVADLALVEAGEPCRAQRHQQRVRLARRTDSPTRRRSAPAASAGRSRAGRSGSTPTCRRRRPAVPAKRAVRFAMSAMPACATISCTPAQRSTSACRCAAIGGRPRPPWMRIGTLRSAASWNTGGSRSSFERDLLRARMELDPARAARRGSGSPPRSGPRSGRGARTG